MSTRGVIARKTEKGWRGRYHHSDSYPSGLGKTLFGLANGFFKGDLKKMLRVLIDEHTGWATINDKDFVWPPQYLDYGSTQHEAAKLMGANPPACYCHGMRNEEGWIVTPKQGPQEWGYVIDVKAGTMEILWMF